MSIDFEPTITTTVKDGYVYASIAYTGEQLDAMARELGKQVDAELFARLAMRHGYVPADMLDECQRENAKLRELVRDVYTLHWNGLDCTECPWFDECDTDGGCPWLGIFADHMRELGVEA